MRSTGDSEEKVTFIYNVTNDMSQMLCEFRDAQSHWEAVGVTGWKESREEDVQMSRRFLSLWVPALPPTSYVTMAMSYHMEASSFPSRRGLTAFSWRCEGKSRRCGVHCQWWHTLRASKYCKVQEIAVCL